VHVQNQEPSNPRHDLEPAAASDLLPEVYEELHALAERWFRRQAPGHTLQPTALVHEAYMKLAKGGAPFESRTHFIAVAARAMRQILVDRARRVRSERHGGGAARIAVDEALVPDRQTDIDLLSLEDALEQLTVLDERKGRVVELRFFGGLEIDQVAEVLGVARSTVTEDWRMARAWLVKELGAT
jgi:RNA polymerase sigma factor (TIGR02999 family)